VRVVKIQFLDYLGQFLGIKSSLLFYTFLLVFSLCAGILKQYKGAMNRVGRGLLYRPARLHSLAELVPWNLFLGSLKVEKFGL
jgi:hypothetical protein